MTALGQASTHFVLPAGRAAPLPPEERGLARDQVRLLVASRDGVTHTTFAHLPGHLQSGDLVVVNTSATVAAVLDHAAGEVLRVGSEVTVTLRRPAAASPASPTGVGNRLWVAAVDDRRALDAALRGRGRPIAYGYLPRPLPLTAYQTVFARHPGSAEMPSAGRPFTAAVVLDLVVRGVAVAPVLLHAGVSSQESGEAPQPERFRVPGSTARLVNATRAAGGRVVAVGTTVTRALESAVADDGRAVGRRGWTDLVLGPQHPPRLVTGLLTGWHDPAASHLLLVESLAGARLTQRAYDAAVAEGYLWHEFGDVCLLLP